LWNDEGTTVQLVSADLRTITRLAASDIHPPLYYYVLHFWVSLFGNSEFAVRSLSALLGTFLVAVVYGLGRRLFGPRAGWLAALVAALAPLQVYYSQEARMYMLTAVLGGVSMLLLASALGLPGGDAAIKGRGRRWSLRLAYVLATSALLYTHYLAFMLLVAQNLLWALVTASRLRERGARWSKIALQRLASWALLQLSVMALYSPWLMMAWAQLRRWPAVSQPFGFVWMVKHALRACSLGITVGSEAWVGIGAACFGLVVLLGTLFGLQRKDHWVSWMGIAFAWLYWGVPVLTLYIISRQRPAWNPKFLLLATPGFYLLVGQGLSAISTALSRLSAAASHGALVISLSLVALASGASLRNLYCVPRYARDDYRGIVRYIEATAGPGDAVIIDAPSQIETVAYYYKGELPVYPLPRHRPLRRAETEEELRSIAARSDRIYAILWATDEADPDHFIESWLESHAYKAMDRWYGNVRLAMYALPGETPTRIEHPLDALLGDSIALLGYTFVSTDVRSGGILQLTLFWRAEKPIERRYKVFVHLLDKDGRVIAQRDAEPGGDMKPTNTWQPGETVLDNYGVFVPLDTASGEHQVEIGMYRLGSGERLPITLDGQPAGDRLLLNPVTVR